MARRTPALATSCASAALVSNISTVIQLAAVTAAIDRTLLSRLALPLIAAGVTIALVSALSVWRTRDDLLPDTTRPGGRAFEPRHALVFVSAVGTVLLVSAAALDRLGHAALGATLALSGFADVHAAAASAAQLVAAGQAPLAIAVSGVAMALATNSISKLVLAWVTGGRGYALRLLPGLVLMVLAFASVALWQPT